VKEYEDCFATGTVICIKKWFSLSQMCNQPLVIIK